MEILDSADCTGADDPGTHDNYGGGGISNRDQNGGNCFLPVII